MLTDQAIDDAASKLEAFRNADTLTKLLDNYSSLLDDYRRLKSDFEEEREGRERYKQLARGQERNPFALVLVDGDSYIFDEDLVRAGEEGGSRAAVRLNEAVRNSLRRRGIENCEIIIRVYANLVGLSKFLSRNGAQCGAEKRALAGFVAGFNRSHGLTDFVDAGELKETASFKLKAMLRLYAENAQCKHIFYAACHDIGYLADVTPFRGYIDRFTLVRTSSVQFCDEFKKLGMSVEELPGVFRITPIQINHPTPTPAPKVVPSQQPARGSPGLPVRTSSPAKSVQSSLAEESGQKICHFDTLGKCKHGSSCRFKHINQATLGSSPVPQQRWSSTERKFDMLPQKSDIPNGYIAINRDGCRLDPYLEPPSAELIARLRASSEVQKFCNNMQLTGQCVRPQCPYNHSPISKKMIGALEWLSRSWPCPKRGACRLADCVAGHVCQNTDCKRRGGMKICRIPKSSHDEDMHFDSLMPGITEAPTYYGANDY
ncbi:E3 ubiquitin-protein ligase makorin [Microdochium nivale]|nr:E3 ubiquitin-protein ligase makorin [Microdochium nivale]